jgi:hypothetical protein
MITFLKSKKCPDCETIAEFLSDLSMGHEVVVAGSGSSSARLPDRAEPPLLVDDKEVVRGHGNVMRHLEELKGFREQWYKFQSDACYCDESGQAE